MIEATCAACGNINRIAEGDVPLGAKFVNCASCKSRVALSTKTNLGAGPGKPLSAPIPTINEPDAFDLADLPAPKRHSPLGAPRSALAAAEPRPHSPSAPGTIDLDELIPASGPLGPGVSDLPTPKSPSARPTMDVSRPAIADLPAPKGPRPSFPEPAAKPTIPDVLAHRSLDSITDLPAPKPKLQPKTPIPKPPPVAPPPIPTRPSDLPAPRTSTLGDLPAPRASGIGDLPTPKLGGLGDLPTPKPSGIGNLPTPKLGGLGDLPTPKPGYTDLPAPRSGGAGELTPRSNYNEGLTPRTGLTDLPTPRSGQDLPAPKGFFDDLPQPARGHADRPDLPAPKGFFEDLPQPSNKPQKPELPAPLGFFEDLPGRVNPNKPQPAEPPAPKGFFEDIPGRVNPNKPQKAELPAPKGFFDDLPQPARPRVDSKSTPPLSARHHQPVDLDAGPALDLDGPSAGGRFDDLDLSTPTAPPVRMDRARTGADPVEDSLPLSSNIKGADFTLDLDEPRGKASPKLAKRKKEKEERVVDPDAARRRARVLKIALVAVLVLAGLGAGGFYMYRRYAEKQERIASIDEQLRLARGAMSAKDAKHWERAQGAANKVLELDAAHSEALGIRAEALFADGIAYGVNATGKFTQARAHLSTAVENAATSPDLERAQALASVVSKQPEAAIPKLEKLVAAAPADLTLALYLGWAHAARGDAAAAIKAFTLAVASDQVKVPALYGRARAKLAQADIEGARADYVAVLDVAKDHVGAQVGLAAALPAAQGQQQEADLLAILQRKDLATADPRAVVQAWVLAGDAAKRGGRLDVARDRYKKAEKLAPQDISIATALAEIDLRDGKPDSAMDVIEKALAQAPNDVRAQLVAAEIAIRLKRLDEAGTRLQGLAGRKPPLSTLEEVQLKMVTGKLLEAHGKDDEAVEAYVEATKLAGDADLAPALTAVTKLGQLAELATKAKNKPRATALRDRAEQIIAKIADNAKKDPQLALTLGMAYLLSNDAEKAELWLQRVVDLRPKDPDAHFQIAKAKSRLERYDEAIDSLQRALALDANRVEIGIELASTYEVSGRDQAAADLYAKLLATKDPSIELRARAGRFYARTNQLAKAGEQGDKIYEVDPTNAAGLYLKAEGALFANKVEDAAKFFRGAVDLDRNAQYLDGQGRAAEAQVVQSGDVKFQDVALRAYQGASELAPTMFNPWAGMGRLYVARREAAKAIPPLIAASKLRENEPDISRLIGLAYKELQEKKVAIEWLARAYKLEANAETAWNLGQLYNEANSPALAITAYANATRLALDDEKKTGKTIPWLTEALYKLGRINMDSSNEKAAKAAWEKFVARNPRAGAQLDEVRRELATTLQRY